MQILHMTAGDPPSFCLDGPVLTLQLGESSIQINIDDEHADVARVIEVKTDSAGSFLSTERGDTYAAIVTIPASISDGTSLNPADVTIQLWGCAQPHVPQGN